MSKRLRWASYVGIVAGLWIVVVASLAVGVRPVTLASFGDVEAAPLAGHAARIAADLPAQAPGVTTDEYIVLVSALYALDGDVERARVRLGLLDLADQGATVADLAERFKQEGRGDLLVVDLATLARALGTERESLLPYVATPTPPPPPPAPGGNGPAPLPTVDWDSRMSYKLEPAVKLIPAEVQAGQTYWRLIRAYWQDPEEGHDKYHIYVNVLNKDGVPITQPIIIENGGKTTVPAEPKPDSEYLINYPMSGTLGSYTCSVAGDIPSDRVAGMGLGFYKGGKDHTSFYLTFQETVAP